MGYGDQSGEQTERNWGQLSATRTRSAPPNRAQINRIAPAGGRAVAGSNPVSPMRSSCKLGCSQGHSNLCCGVQNRGRGAISARDVLRSVAVPGRSWSVECTRSPTRVERGRRARAWARSCRRRARGTTSALVAAEGDCNGRDAVPDVAFLTTRRRLASSDRRGSCRRRQGRAAATTDRPPGCGSTLVERPYERVRAVEHAVGIRVPHPQVERDQVGVPEGERGAAVGALGRA